MKLGDIKISLRVILKLSITAIKQLRNRDSRFKGFASEGGKEGDAVLRGNEGSCSWEKKTRGWEAKLKWLDHPVKAVSQWVGKYKGRISQQARVEEWWAIVRGIRSGAIDGKA